MKMKHRALTLLLTIAMLLTFMPALAFADGDDDYSVIFKDSNDAPISSLNYDADNRVLSMDDVSSIIVKKDGAEDKTFTKNQQGQYLYNEQELVFDCYDYYIDEQGGSWLEACFYSDLDSSTTDFEFYFDIPITVVSDVESISYTPSKVTVDSKEAREQENGRTYYSIYARNKEGGFFVDGDKLIVNYTTETKEFIFDEDSWEFKCGQESIDRSLVRLFVVGEDAPFSFKVGLNKEAIMIRYGKAETFLDLYVDNSREAAEQAAAAEAARQGVNDGSIPKVKASKPKKAKTSITVKWKKPNKKKMKKAGITNFEIWVCTDGAFASGSTIERVVGKKSSLKIKGLAKNTRYYAKVRAIKYVGGTKVVGPWSAVKKVKTKKK